MQIGADYCTLILVMNAYKIFLIMLAAMTGASVSPADAVVVQNFSRYDIILQRRPFGDAAPTAAELAVANRPVVPTGPSFIDSLRLCAITDGGGAIRVGFVDIKSKPPKTYFLFVGQSEDGIEVVDADYENESVMLRKDGDERELVMAGGAAAPVSGSKTIAKGGRGRVVTSSGRIVSEVRKRRMDLRKQRSLQLPDLSGQVLKAHLRQYNMAAIREGMPPLPIPLSPEEDDQLVAEGILAPVE